MHRTVVAFGALVALAPALLLAQDKDKKEQEKYERNNPKPVPGWNPELQQGFAEARKTGKPLMIVFR